MNARSRFSQSAIPNGHTACGPAKMTIVCGKKRVFLEHSMHLAVQDSIDPCLKVWYCHRPKLFDCHLHSEIMNLYMPVYRSSPCLKWCPNAGASLFRIISPVISGNHLLQASCLVLQSWKPLLNTKYWVLNQLVTFCYSIGKSELL